MHCRHCVKSVDLIIWALRTQGSVRDPNMSKYSSLKVYTKVQVSKYMVTVVNNCLKTLKLSKSDGNETQALEKAVLGGIKCWYRSWHHPVGSSAAPADSVNSSNSYYEQWGGRPVRSASSDISSYRAVFELCCVVFELCCVVFELPLKVAVGRCVMGRIGCGRRQQQWRVRVRVPTTMTVSPWQAVIRPTS